MPATRKPPKESTRESLSRHVQILELRAELARAMRIGDEVNFKPQMIQTASAVFLLGAFLFALGDNGKSMAFVVAGGLLCLSAVIYLAYTSNYVVASTQRKKRLGAILNKARSMESPAAAPLLLEMVNRLYDDELSEAIWAELDTLLPRVTEEHLPYFTKASVERLNSYLTRSNSRQSLLSPITVVRCLGVVGDEESLQSMQIVLHAQPFLRGRDWEGLCKVIREVSPPLQMRLQNARETQSLLRPSQAPDEHTMLLRPSHESATPPEELLRSASKEGEED